MKLVLIGYYGYDNIGDEMLLSSLLNKIKQAPFIKCKVLTYNAKKTSSTYDVQAISRGKNFSLIKSIFNSDALVIGGGSILQDITSSLSLYYYLFILFLSKIFRKKIFLIGNGIGPLNKNINKKLVGFLVPKIDGIISRDTLSYKEFLNFGAKNIHSGVDMVFSYQKEDFKNKYKRKSGRPYVAISLRNWKGVENLQPVIQKMCLYLDEKGFDTVFIPMKNPDDVNAAEFMKEKYEFVTVFDGKVKDVVNIISNSYLAIGMRLHFLILSAIYEKPFIAISYDPKVDSLCEQFYGKKHLDVKNIKFEDLKSKVDDFLINYDTYKKIVTDKKNENEEKAKKDLDLFLEWLEEE